MKYFALLMALLLAAPARADGLQNAIPAPYPAPEFAGIEAWMNGPALTMQSLKGKVVLVDFWTYSCINCLRTLPTLTKWDVEYRDKGLVIVGVHTPEFSFETVQANVAAALKKYGIHYAVALDNKRGTWNAFHNRYWPAHYLIDKDGRVVYSHFGEGEYDVTENNIRALLGLPAKQMGQGTSPVSAAQTPETYLGTARAGNADYWSLTGAWQHQPDRITAEKAGATLRLHFYARKVFLVLGSQTGKPIKAMLTLNGKPLGDSAGGDAPGGTVTVNQHALYELIKQPAPAVATLELTTEPGLEAYAFTFGN